MDHNLEVSINLDSSMGEGYEHTEDVEVNQADINLDTGANEGDIQLEFEQIEEQPMLMDTGNEEIIISDFIGDQFSLQEYSEQNNESAETMTTVVSNPHSDISSQSQTMIDLQYDTQQVTPTVITQDTRTQPKVIAVKGALPTIRSMVNHKTKESAVITTVPRQVPIAPKPAPKAPTPQKSTFTPKQYAIAPKPVTVVTNRATSLVKKVSLEGKQGNTKGNAVFAQIGKKFVMLPAGGSQKFKLVTANSSGVPSLQYIRSSTDQAQLIPNKTIQGSQPSKTVLTKVIVQGQPNIDPNNQPAVITKLSQAGKATSPQARYVMQQKTVPISVANKVLISSPTKSFVKFTKKQVPAKLFSATAPTTTPKKVLITANPAQKVILRATSPPKTTQLIKEDNIHTQSQHTQLHQINVPGKGIQYIRLITPAPIAKSQPVSKPQPTKTFVLSDSKGNLIQMRAEKLVTSQPPPLVMTGSTAGFHKLVPKPQQQQKLVRIAPVQSRSHSQQPTTRSSQSLLAPLSPVVTTSTSSVSEEIVEEETSVVVEEEEVTEQAQEMDVEVDSKAALRALLAEAASDAQEQSIATNEVVVEFEGQQSSIEEEEEGEESSVEQHDSSGKAEEHPLIVIPCEFPKQQQQIVPDRVTSEQAHDDLNSIMDVDVYESPPSQALSDTDMVSTEFGLRPRKACNCTKSQCLKLYCDCFANGEFCNRCNCINCHNNLENEEVRQRAIRGCLDRNPNAFRPKIGKARSGGPEIIRRHYKGCNCKRSGCLKNYCECYEAKIACTSMCKCVGCRNVEETLERARRRGAGGQRERARPSLYRPPALAQVKQPCSFMTSEVIEAVCQCMLAAAVTKPEAADASDGTDDNNGKEEEASPSDPIRDVIIEFSRCLQDIIGAAHQSGPITLLDEDRT